MLPLDLHLMKEIKAKMVGNIYVEFSQLISRDLKEQGLTLQLTDGEKQQRLTVNQQMPKAWITNSDAWARAFDIYSYAYLADKEARALVKYRALIMSWPGWTTTG